MIKVGYFFRCNGKLLMIKSRRQPRGRAISKIGEIDHEGAPANTRVPLKSPVDMHLHASVLTRHDDMGGCFGHFSPSRVILQNCTCSFT